MWLQIRTTDNLLKYAGATTDDQTSSASPKPSGSAGCRRASSCRRPIGISPPVRINPSFGLIAETGEREMVLMRWGLIPAKIADPDSLKIFTTTNARTESILDKPIWTCNVQVCHNHRRSNWENTDCSATYLRRRSAHPNRRQDPGLFINSRCPTAHPMPWPDSFPSGGLARAALILHWTPSRLSLQRPMS